MLKNHLKRILIGLVLGLIGGVLYWRFAPRVYDSLEVAFINSQSDTRTNDESSNEVSHILGVGDTQNVISEVDMLRAENMFKRALEVAAGQAGDDNLKTYDMEQKLFPMYDVEANKDSHIVTVDVKAFDPVEAALIANAVVEEFNKQRKYIEQRSYNDAISYVKDQIAADKGLLEATDAQLTKFKQNKGLINPQSDEQVVSSRQQKLKDDLSSAQMDLAVQNRELTAQRAEYAKRQPTYETGHSEARNPILNAFESKMAELDQQRAALLVHYTEQSDKVKQVDQTIADEKKLYAQYLAHEYQTQGKQIAVDPLYQELDKNLAMAEVSKVSLESRISALTAEIAKVNQQAKDLPSLEHQEDDLGRDKQMYEGRYAKLEHQLDDLNYKANSNAKPADDWGSGAQPNYVQVSPLAVKAIPLGAAAGAVLFLLLSLAIEALRSTVRTSAEVTGVLGLPVTATVPMLKAKEAQRRMATLAEPSFVPLEGFRFMASAAALAVDTSRRVLFTGVGGSVGCSTSAAEFAVASARMGVKTILIDADLNMMTVSKAFGVSNKPGMRDILNHTLLPSSGEGTLLQETEHKNLSILPAGSDEGLGIADVPSAQLAAVLETIAPYAQLIVIDCPPFDVLADAARFVPYVDEACLVVSAKKTHLQSIMIVEKLIQRAGAHTVSIVLTETGNREEAFSKRRYRAKAS
jgi:Mrp family chromosome partitioning ATPase/uncharacterized protein involved in exopolysaccharide biosynthesis